MKFPIALPEEQAIRERFGGEIQQIERKFEADKEVAERRYGGLLTHELGKNKRWIYGGTAAAAVAIFGGSILTMIKTAVAISAWGFLLAAMIIFGVIAWRKLPRYELELANRERERIQVEMERHIHEMRRIANEAVLAKRAQEAEHIKALEDQVRRDPIPYLEAGYRRKELAHKKFKDYVSRIGAFVKRYENRLRRAKEDQQGMDLSGEMREVERLKLYHKNRLDRVPEGRAILDKVWQKLERARIQWDLKLIARESMAEEERMKYDLDAALEDVLMEVGFGEVEQQYEEIFARIETDNADMGTKQLEFGPTVKFDLSKTEVREPELVPVAR